MERRCPTCGGTNLQSTFGGRTLRCMDRNCQDYKKSKAYGLFLPDTASASPTAPQPDNPGFGQLLGGGPLPQPLARNAKERLEQLQQMGVFASRLEGDGLHDLADRLDRIILG